MTGSCRTCGSRLPAGRLAACPRCLFDKGDDVPLLAGYLELEDEIGRGGMGAVYRAQDRRLGRTVAVKLLHPELARDATVRARFAREARSLAGLSHPHIVHVYDVGEEEGEPFLVLEHVVGGSLASLVPCPPVRALELGVAIADALAYAHAHGIVHRDVKPGNVLLDSAGRPKVADFGIARPLQPGSGWTVTRTDLAAGTPAYMAPEALSGAPPDPRSDVYSLGVLLHELATGELPRGAFEPAPEPLGAIVRRALAPDPAKRYPTAAALRDDLARGLEELKGLARAATAETPATPAPVVLPHTPTSAATPASPATPAAPLPAPVSGIALPADERIWRSAVALVLVLASGALWYDVLASVQPKVLVPGESLPLLVLDAQRQADGTLLSRARFETVPTVVAVGAWTVALLAVALLRAHWRHARLEVETPERRIPEGRRTLAWGLVALALYGSRLLAQATHSPLAAAAPYVPIVGAGIEIGVLYSFWTVVLEAARTARPLVREPVLFLGLFLAGIPPLTDLARHLWWGAS